MLQQPIVVDHGAFTSALQVVTSALLALASFLFLHVWRRIERVEDTQHDHATRIAVIEAQRE